MTDVPMSSQRWIGADEKRINTGADSHAGQELMGHKDVATMMIHTHVLNRGGLGVRSSLDMDPRQGCSWSTM